MGIGLGQYLDNNSALPIWQGTIVLYNETTIMITILI